MNTEIKRYNMVYNEWECDWYCVEDKEGGWVRYCDVNKIRAQAVRDAVTVYKKDYVGQSVETLLLDHADKLERGEA